MEEDFDDDFEEDEEPEKELTEEQKMILEVNKDPENGYTYSMAHGEKMLEVFSDLVGLYHDMRENSPYTHDTEKEKEPLLEMQVSFLESLYRLGYAAARMEQASAEQQKYAHRHYHLLWLKESKEHEKTKTELRTLKEAKS